MRSAKKKRRIPSGRPGRYRRHDLWVDESSFQTRRLVTEGNFTGKETCSHKWTVSYAQLHDAWYSDTEISQGPVVDPTGRFERVAVQFVDVAADPHDKLDFGISGSRVDHDLVEPE